MSKRAEIAKRASQETYERVKKQMTCKWYCNGGDCGKGLPGTPCELAGCVAWEEYKEDSHE
ncbi:MAG: hypothetical protein J6W09_11270 [Bacteroidales bacterium]|nr:hypothetical protein [Bacteroidales bacterium]